MEQRRNEEAGETGDPRENPPTSGIVRHDSHMRNARGRPRHKPNQVRLGFQRFRAAPNYELQATWKSRRRSGSRCIGIQPTGRIIKSSNKPSSVPNALPARLAPSPLQVVETKESNSFPSKIPMAQCKHLCGTALNGDEIDPCPPKGMLPASLCSEQLGSARLAVPFSGGVGRGVGLRYPAQRSHVHLLLFPAPELELRISGKLENALYPLRSPTSVVRMYWPSPKPGSSPHGYAMRTVKCEGDAANFIIILARVIKRATALLLARLCKCN
ncbi:hypothetical protein PR048_028812 [Dryococelus australis]|uniref:Uncharacterized protein n=1 Tax=Dryococelus australis TaxID=614101 RepID=A0ABQ9GFB1_9NEOP|nr:hypothetical protein PR048_028812 [Dryococelus australis]